METAASLAAATQANNRQTETQLLGTGSAHSVMFKSTNVTDRLVPTVAYAKFMFLCWCLRPKVNGNCIPAWANVLLEKAPQMSGCHSHLSRGVFSNPPGKAM